MAVFDLFSKRQKRARGEVPDVFAYDQLPVQLRVQIVHIIRDALGKDHYSSEYAKEAFPDLENVNIKIAFLRRGGREEKTEMFTKDNFPGNGVRCSNPICKNGGLSEITIPLLIKKMLSEKKVQLKEHKFCNGGLYKGQTKYNDCGWSFSIDISIQLNEDSLVTNCRNPAIRIENER